eukprot:CAMPEP_0113464768 /NCGR_PEP_ID=MMETSP0014_2-20120614/13374_1 /TAXON_ID=2857 /ORGANISM="Nitzschia sp." /LENGTH=107 /DNA_ID=CAMNT_0000356865 /DNA_START=455 /DNA_END=776 /DNA_ORIENTATION=+ /assembly_acc=CAM_ASM_000159
MTQCQPRPQSPSSLRTSRRRLRKGFLNTLDEMVDEQLHDDPALLQALSVQNMMEMIKYSTIELTDSVVTTQHGRVTTTKKSSIEAYCIPFATEFTLHKKNPKSHKNK